jgi:hypothetical protein
LSSGFLTSSMIFSLTRSKMMRMAEVDEDKDDEDEDDEDEDEGIQEEMDANVLIISKSYPQLETVVVHCQVHEDEDDEDEDDEDEVEGIQEAIEDLFQPSA